MATRITVNQVAEILKSHRDIPPATLRAVVEEMNAVTQPDEKDDPAPRTKSQLTVILLDPEHKVKGDFTALIVQQPETADAGTTLSRVYQAAYDYNASPKRKLTVKTVGDAADTIKRKQWKAVDLLLKTRVPVRVLVSDNTIPTA